MSSTEIAPLRTLGLEAEVRRLVPPVPVADEDFDDTLQVRLHRHCLPLELPSPGVRETRAGLCLQLVQGQVLGRERERLREIVIQVGGALARDAVDEVERDVVETGIAKSMHRTPDVVRPRPSLEHGQEPRREALGTDRHPGHLRIAELSGERRRHGLRVRLHGHLNRFGQGGEQPGEGCGLGQRRRTTPEEQRLERTGQHAALELQLLEQRVDVELVRARAVDQRDEVAIAAAVGAERQVNVEVADVSGHD